MSDVGKSRRLSRRLKGTRPELSTSDLAKLVNSPARRRPKKDNEIDGTEEQNKEVQKVNVEPENKENGIRPKDKSRKSKVNTLLAKKRLTEEQIESFATESKPSVSEPELTDKNEKKENKGLVEKPKLNVIKGRCKSGRFWKSERGCFRSIKNSPGLKQDYQARLKQKESMKRSKDLEKMMKEETKRKREALRARQEENKKKREENARKSEVVQLIKNPNKIKRMKKKQLKMLSKRDVVNAKN